MCFRLLEAIPRPLKKAERVDRFMKSRSLMESGLNQELH